MTFSRSDFHPKKEHSHSHVTDKGRNMERKDLQRWCRLFFEDYYTLFPQKDFLHRFLFDNTSVNFYRSIEFIDYDKITE